MKQLYAKGLMAFTFLAGATFAQQNDRLKSISQEYLLNNDKQVHFIKLKDNYPVYENNTEGFLNSILSDNGEITAKKIKVNIDNLGYTHAKYQLYYGATPINNAIIAVHAQHGKVVSVNGDLNAIQKPVNSVVINEAAALRQALQKVSAKKYKWENKAEEQHMRQVLNKPGFSYQPKGELMLYSKENSDKTTSVHFAYKFMIYAEEPLYKANVIVDAQSGIVLAEENLICTVDVPATANTKYSGTQNLTMDNYTAGSYRLRETARGNGIETYNLSGGSNYGSATDFTTTAATWTTTGNDQAASDAHWGAEMTYDYYWNAHNINSIDNAGYKLLSYVHYSTAYNNAFWDGTRMTYGDGDGSQFTILTALDVCGHEITHGLVSNTANLGSGEAGALNEGFADIFGTTIENYARPTAWDWKIGADITPGGNGIRNMSNPNLINQPDTYMGTYWSASGEVHTNDGPAIYWYYLLCQGGSGTNDLSNAYSVTGIGMTSAAKIAFRALTVYFTPTTNYAAARNYCIQAAKDLYGNCSNEVIQCTNAWYAVGVGPAYSYSIAPNFNALSTSYCTSPASVSFNNTTANGINYAWDFGDGSVSTSTNPVHSYTANGVYSVKLVATGCSSTIDSITKTSYITINTPASPAATGASFCAGNSGSLSASGTGQVYWYASPTATGTPLNIGSSYSTPTLTNTTTYYVVNTSTNAPVFGAPTSTAIGTSANYNFTTAYDIFDVFQPCTLKTVVMYASSAGNRTVQLRSSSNTVITSTVVNLAVGANTVNLNFVLTPGTGYRIGTGSGTINLYRNSTGAAYPYNIGGLVNITGSSATGSPSYFYFFYNWQVQKENCVSPAVPVTATVVPGPSVTVNSATVCSGSAASLVASGAATYSWSSGQNTSSISVNPASNTSYTVYGDNGGCAGMSVANVIVNPLPSVAAAAAQNTACVNDPAFALFGTPAGGTFSGAGVSGNNFDPITGAGNYTVTYMYTDANGCTGSGSTNIDVFLCTGIQSLAANTAVISIYPNPVADYFTVINGSNANSLTLKIYDVNGKLVMQKTIQANGEQVNAASLSSGTYFVELLDSGNRLYTTHLIRQ